MTIHQPSLKVLNLIDNLLVLGSGKEIYYGETRNLKNYFDKINKPVPPHLNPSDHILDLINQDFIGDQSKAEGIVEKFAN